MSIISSVYYEYVVKVDGVIRDDLTVWLTLDQANAEARDYEQDGCTAGVLVRAVIRAEWSVAE